jgi:hypothetical protein
MWVLVLREPLPDAHWWPRRHLLAAIDAMVWPLAWVLIFLNAPKPVGLMGPFVSSVAILYGLRRLHRALWLNHRYRFATWRWGRIAAGMMLLGFILQGMLALQAMYSPDGPPRVIRNPARVAVKERCPDRNSTPIAATGRAAAGAKGIDVSSCPTPPQSGLRPGSSRRPETVSGR